MNLPNYFLADLPPEATLSVSTLTEACQTLKRNRARYLADLPTAHLIKALTSVARSWLEPDDRFRKIVLDQGPAAMGFCRSTLDKGLDAFFGQLTEENLHALLEQDLGHPHRLDQFVSSPPEQKSSRLGIVTAPELLVHITAGNLPVPALMSITLGLLVRSAQFVKCATGCAFLPRLFAHSIYEVAPKLGACLELSEWRGGSARLEETLAEEADCITATGTDETIAEIRSRLPRKTRFLGYGNRVSFGYIAGEAISGWNARRIAEHTATDVGAWNQQGCLSPHVIYVQEGAAINAEKFGELLSEALAQHEAMEPRGDLPVEPAAVIASRRSLYEVRAAHSPETRVWSSPGSTAWTVVYETDPHFQLSCLNRFVYVKPVKDLTTALQGADSIRSKVSTVGIAAPDKDLQQLATELARWGATRVCPLGQMQNPPLTWRHDGRPALADLVTWTDWEIAA